MLWVPSRKSLSFQKDRRLFFSYINTELLFFSYINTELLFFRLPEDENALEKPKVVKALASGRSAYERLRQRATVLKVARDQGWHVARELSILQDQDEDPLLKKAMKNAAKRYVDIRILCLFLLKQENLLFLLKSKRD